GLVAVERFEARPRLASAFAYGRRGSPGGTSDRPSCGLPGSLAAEAEHGAVGNRTEDARTQSGEVLGGVHRFLPPRFVPERRPTEADHSAGAPLGNSECSEKIAHSLAPSGGLYHFFRTTALSIWMSRAW